jgi:hypothetical protein
MLYIIIVDFCSGSFFAALTMLEQNIRYYLTMSSRFYFNCLAAPHFCTIILKNIGIL